MIDIKATLSAIPQLASLSDTELDILQTACTAEDLKENSILFFENDTKADLFLLVDGLVEARVRVPSHGGDACLRLVKPGRLLGELVFLAGGRQCTTGVAREVSQAIRLRGTTLQELCRIHPSIALAVYRWLGFHAAESARENTIELRNLQGNY